MEKKQFAGSISPETINAYITSAPGSQGGFVGLWFGDYAMIESCISELAKTEWWSRAGTQFVQGNIQAQWYGNRQQMNNIAYSLQGTGAGGGIMYPLPSGYNSITSMSNTSSATFLHRSEMSEFQLLAMKSNKMDVDIDTIRVAMNAGTILESGIFVLQCRYDMSQQGNGAFSRERRTIANLIPTDESNNTALTFRVSSRVGYNSALCIGIPMQVPNASGLNVTINTI